MEPKKNLIKILGVSFGIIAVLLGAIWYAKTDIDKKFLAIQQLQTDIKAKEISLSELAKLQGDAEKAKQYIPQIDRLFTSKDQLLAFSTDISFISKQAGFSGSPQFKEETSPSPTDLQKTSFALLIEGPKNFNDLANFFRTVERSKYFVRFMTLDISRDGDILRLGANGYVLSF